MSETKPVLDECPDCGGTNLSPGNEVNDRFWSEHDTACHDCTLVFTEDGHLAGGFDSDVAKELHRTAVNELKRKLGVETDE